MNGSSKRIMSSENCGIGVTQWQPPLNLARESSPWNFEKKCTWIRLSSDKGNTLCKVIQPIIKYKVGC